MENLNRDNVSDFYFTAPRGRSFSAKKLSDEAKRLLRAYWNNTLNCKEKREEIAKDRENGMKYLDLQDDYYWANKYSMYASRAEGFLSDRKFLLKIKKS